MPSLPVVALEKVLVFKTNIATKQQRNSVLKVLAHLPGIEECWIDIDDCDNILRVVGNTDNKKLQAAVEVLGFEIETLK